MFPTTPSPGCCHGISSQKDGLRCWDGSQSRWRPGSAAAHSSKCQLSHLATATALLPAARVSACLQAKRQELLLRCTFTCVSISRVSFQVLGMCAMRIFFIWDNMYEFQRGGVAQISLKLRCTHSRQLSSYLCLQYAINITLFRKYSMENIPWVN